LIIGGKAATCCVCNVTKVLTACAATLAEIATADATEAALNVFATLESNTKDLIELFAILIARTYWVMD
jgi:hypothetical protein